MGFSLGSLGSAVSSGFSSALSGAMDFGKAMWQNTQNKKAATKAYQREVELMNMQNAYNTPAAQMARYEEAGLNPNLIYGQQNLSASASSVPMSKGASVGSSHLEGALNRNFQQQQVDMNLKKLGQDLQLGQAQIDQVRASTYAILEQARSSGANADTLEWNLGIAKDRGMSTATNGNFKFGILDFLRNAWKNGDRDLEKDNYFIPPVKK